jgi:hypothetical protein
MAPEQDWPRYFSGAIMWGEPEDWQRPVGCPLCGAAVLDAEKHVEWHESAPGRPMTANRR